MNLENKQRVIGIVVLVAFIALLIPFLFTNGIKKRHKLAEEVDLIDQEQIPVVDKEETTASPIFMQESVEEVADSSQQEQSVSKTQTTVVLPDPSEVKEVSQQVVEKVKEVVSEVPAVLERVEVPPVAEPKKPEIKIIPPKVQSKSKKTGIKSSRFWSVQAGSFADQARAERLVTKLQNRGFDVYLQKITTNRGVMVRVLVGRENSKSAAVKIADRLKTKMNIDGLVVAKK